MPEPEVEEPPRRQNRFVTALLVVAVGVFCVFSAFRLLGFDGNAYVAAALALTPYVAVAGVLLTAITLLLRRWATGIVVFAVAAVLVAAMLPRTMSADQPDATGAELRVMSANLYFGRADVGHVVQLVRNHRIDVLSLQELTPAAVGALDRAGLFAELPHRVFHAMPGASGTGIAARYPLRERQLAGPALHAQPAALVDLPGHADAEVVAVHPLTPVHDFEAWQRELAGLPGVDTQGPPRLLVGDFNASLDHRAFRDILRKGYSDAADAVGEGLSMTWSQSRWPPVAIDHVLADFRYAVREFQVFDLPGSDHDPIYARVQLP
ncbi:endonuclease/exonuclease/phosphatase (EEP) superfamily protein YafD [Herbihabitans rhizosphaerae]|uniref:Endonuclease/exonuclease/phosphatase (EEP) superfamily protein YafD n=2 Tax=Herbihabitans rhizosphaerae TaxID=1872711 RepID=A0A4Q7KZN1_9PSEU|nr:endonuclease/exonuclease/phosphatase (EEP) superfamily protein YafD [Herbihabitans rhizosphaerae]